MSKRMTSETIIFDTDWLTEADFEEGWLVAKIDYQAYDAIKAIVDIENIDLSVGELFQEFEVYKLKNLVNSEITYRAILIANDGDLLIRFVVDESDVGLTFGLDKTYWEENIKGIGSIYITGVKR